ncbi:MAG: hypothetical protein AAF488_04770, partial [Planctomycetota bacterium]
RDRYEDLAGLAYESETSQLQWEARARTQLGEIALRQGDPKDSTRHIRIALRHTNDLLARDPGSLNQRAERFVERGKLLFLLGDVELAMDDFRKAGELAPDNGAESGELAARTFNVYVNLGKVWGSDDPNPDPKCASDRVFERPGQTPRREGHIISPGTYGAR